jgi:hypothetical protein
MTRITQISKRIHESIFMLNLVYPRSVIRGFPMAYLDQFLQIVVQQEASDLHIAEGEPPKIRVHGDICRFEPSRFRTMKPSEC